MGLTFKENCADIRNSGVKDVVEKLKENNCNLDLYDPWADNEEIKKIYDIVPHSKLSNKFYDGIIIALYRKFREMGKSKILNL